MPTVSFKLLTLRRDNVVLSPKAMLVVGEVCSVQYLWQSIFPHQRKCLISQRKFKRGLFITSRRSSQRCFVLFKNDAEGKAKIIRERHSLNSHSTSQFSLWFLCQIWRSLVQSLLWEGLSNPKLAIALCVCLRVACEVCVQEKEPSPVQL